MDEFINKIVHEDALAFLPKLKASCVDLVLTDPPYFLDKMDHNWNVKKVNNKKNLQTVQSLPAGMKFDKKQGENFYLWYLKISKEIFRTLKPGGFFFSFSSPRLYHRMACAIDDAGFEIRDSFIWLYTQNQPKAMSLNHFIKRLDISEEKKNQVIENLSGWKTPQVKSCFEPIAMAQKPTHGTFLSNTLKYNVSLINTKTCQGIDGDMFPSNVVSSEKIGKSIDKVFLARKPAKKEKGEFNNHKTVKPVSLCEYLIALTTNQKALILDPFSGSGTTALACKRLNRNFIGVEMHKEYIDISYQRLRDYS